MAAVLRSPGDRGQRLERRNAGHLRAVNLGDVLVGHLHSLGAFIETGLDGEPLEAGETLPDDLQPALGQALVPVNGELGIPLADAHLLAHLLQALIRNGPLAGVPARAGPVHGRCPDHVSAQRIVLDDVLAAELGEDIHQPGHVLLALHHDVTVDVDVRPRHQPQPDLGHDTEIGLGEDAVQGRSESTLEDGAEIRSLHGPHSRADQFAVRKHHLHAAHRLHMVAHRRHAITAVQRVAEDRSPARGRERTSTVSGPGLDVVRRDRRRKHRARSRRSSACRSTSMILFIRLRSKATMSRVRGSGPP